MSARSEFACRFVGADPQLRRLLGYWAATGVFYSVSIAILWLFVRNGSVERAGGEPFAATILRADRAMYVAKSTGRDRLVTA